MDFNDIMLSVVTGKSATMNDSLQTSGFSQYGVKIPVGYGINLTIYPPDKIYSWCDTDIEKWAFHKFMVYGGGIPVDVEWMNFNICHCALYFNKELGVIIVLKVDIENLIAMSNAKVDTGGGSTNRYNQIAQNQEQYLKQQYPKMNFKELYKLQEMLCNTISGNFGVQCQPILWQLFIPFFENWYYGGLIRRGRILPARR